MLRIKLPLPVLLSTHIVFSPFLFHLFTALMDTARELHLPLSFRGLEKKTSLLSSPILSIHSRMKSEHSLQSQSEFALLSARSIPKTALPSQRSRKESTSVHSSNSGLQIISPSFASHQTLFSVSALQTATTSREYSRIGSCDFDNHFATESAFSPLKNRKKNQEIIAKYAISKQTTIEKQ